MGLTITIGGTARTSACQVESIHITESLETNANMMEATLAVPDLSWWPRAGNEVVVSTSSDGVRHFGGSITKVRERATNQRAMSYSITCLDYIWLFDRRLVTKNYTAQAASAVIADVVNTYTTGFSTGGITASPTVAAQRFDYVPPSQVVRTLADQLQWRFYVDYNRVPQFFTAIMAIAPTTAINFDTSTGYSDLVLEEDASQTRNRAILQGYKVKSTIQFARSFLGDSTTRFFWMGQEPASVSSSEITVTVAGNPIDVLTDFVDSEPGSTVGSSSQAFVCYTNMGIRFSTGSAAPSSTIAVSFNYMKDGGIQYDDPSAQTEMASRSSGDGVHMFMMNDPNLTNFAANDDLALARGAAITARYGKPTLEGSFFSFTQGWGRGQYLTGYSTARMGGFNRTLYITQVEKWLAQHLPNQSPVWKYKVAFSDSALP